MTQNKSAKTCASNIFMFLGLSFVLPICVLSQQLPKDTARPEALDSAQIADIIHHWETSWNSHDMNAFANLFHEDAIWILWTGEIWKGRIAIEEGHAKVHKTIFRNSIQREEVEEISFVGPEAAVVRFSSTLTGDERYPDKIVRSRKILIVTKRANIWKVGWGQNTRFADAPTK